MVSQLFIGRPFITHTSILIPCQSGRKRKQLRYTGDVNISQNVSLANYSTMGLGGQAAYLTDITSRQEVPEADTWAKSRQLPTLMIGGGSNIIWRDEGFAGLVMINRIAG